MKGPETVEVFLTGLSYLCWKFVQSLMIPLFFSSLETVAEVSRNAEVIDSSFEPRHWL